MSLINHHVQLHHYCDCRPSSVLMYTFVCTSTNNTKMLNYYTLVESPRSFTRIRIYNYRSANMGCTKEFDVFKIDI